MTVYIPQANNTHCTNRGNKVKFCGVHCYKRYKTKPSEERCNKITNYNPTIKLNNNNTNQSNNHPPLRSIVTSCVVLIGVLFAAVVREAGSLPSRDKTFKKRSKQLTFTWIETKQFLFQMSKIISKQSQLKPKQHISFRPGV